jgi:RNA polymerase sigma-70 factor (ECF subfamily)
VELFSFDELYLQRLRNRDHVTERHFIAYFSKLLLIKLRSRLKSSQAVEDIRQETFLRVFKAVRVEGSVRQPERLGAFVNSICNNVLQEHFRSSTRVTPLDEDSPDPPDPAIGMDQVLVTRQTSGQVRRILAQLPEKDRALLRALFMEEKDKDEVCRQFGVNRTYLRVLLYRAKQSFRVFYEKSESGGQSHVEH